MTEQEKKMLNDMIDVGKRLNVEIGKVNPDREKCASIIFSPGKGYVSVHFVKDGIDKSARAFDEYEGIDYMEVEINV